MDAYMTNESMAKSDWWTNMGGGSRCLIKRKRQIDQYNFFEDRRSKMMFGIWILCGTAFFFCHVDAYLEYSNMAPGYNALVRRRSMKQPSEGRMFDNLGYNQESLVKRNFDEIDNVGFNDFGPASRPGSGRSWFPKRNWELARYNLRRLVKRATQDELMENKRQELDEIDKSGFGGFHKRNFDEIDRSGFNDFGKRSFDRFKLVRRADFNN